MLVYRTFKRNYHRLKLAYNEVAKFGDISIEMKGDKNGGEAKIKLPPDNELIQFIVLMRPFLTIKSPIFYKEIWQTIQQEFPNELINLDKQIISNINNMIDKLQQGYIGLIYNKKRLSFEEIYDLLSNGIYFSGNKNIKHYLDRLFNRPFVNQLTWYNFYSFNFDAFILITNLFNIILRIEKSTRYETLYTKNFEPKDTCIYCLDSRKIFSSEEHIYPESLGNDELVLQKGFVCDECNNGVLATLDNYILNFEPIAFLQVQYVPFKKDGSFPKANFQNMIIEKTHPRHISITAKDKTGMPQNMKTNDDGTISWNTQFRGNKFDPKRLARSIYKIALGTLAFNNGHNFVCNSKYNLARNFILKGEGFNNNLLMLHNVTPNPKVKTGCFNTNNGTFFVIDIFGIGFIINLEEYPKLELDEDMRKMGFNSYNLK